MRNNHDKLKYMTLEEMERNTEKAWSGLNEENTSTYTCLKLQKAYKWQI